MTFEERKAIASKLVWEFMMAFSVPRGLPQEQQVSRMSAIAEAFARRLPTKGDYEEGIQRVFDKVRDSHLSNSWPPQAVFVIYMPGHEVKSVKAAETFTPNQLEVAASKMRDGQPVAERYVWGASSDALIHSGKIDRDTMDKYRKASVASFQSVYQHRTIETMVKKLGQSVAAYFSENEVAA